MNQKFRTFNKKIIFDFFTTHEAPYVYLFVYGLSSNRLEYGYFYVSPFNCLKEKTIKYIFYFRSVFIPYLTRCRSRTSIFFGLWQCAWPSWRWDPSIWWCCRSIVLLASLFRACPRPCPPIDLFAGNNVSWHEWQLSFLYSGKEKHFGTCDMSHVLVRDSSCQAYSKLRLKIHIFNTSRRYCGILLFIRAFNNAHQAQHLMNLSLASIEILGFIIINRILLNDFLAFFILQ